MSRSGPSEIMAVIARRGDVLRAVGAGEISKRDLVDRLDVSRSTVDRSIRELEALDLIERATSGYRQTLPGRVALEEFERFETRIDGLVRSRKALVELSNDVPFDGAILDDAEVVLAERHSPHVPITRYCDLVERATSVRSMSPAVFPQSVSTYYEAVVERGMDARLVVSDAVIERLVAAYADELREMLATGRLELRRRNDQIPYGLAVADTPTGARAAILMYAEGGACAYLANDSPAAVEWASNKFDDAWTAARSIPVPLSDG